MKTIYQDGKILIIMSAKGLVIKNEEDGKSVGIGIAFQNDGGMAITAAKGTFVPKAEVEPDGRPLLVIEVRPDQ